MINTAVLTGRLVKDPELKKTRTGKSVCGFILAVNKHIKPQNGPDADFIACQAWGKTAEVICQYLQKGSLLGVEGRIETGSYDNPQGQRVYTTKVVVNQMTFLESRKDTGQQNPYGAGQAYGQSRGQTTYRQPADYQSDTYDGLDVSDADLPF